MKKRQPKAIEFVATARNYEDANKDMFQRWVCDDFDVGDVVIIPQTHWAIIIKDGELMDAKEMGRWELFETQKKGLFGKKEKTECKVEVIYLSKTVRMACKWGTSEQFDYIDTVNNQVVKVGAHGDFEMNFANPRKAYLEIIGITDYVSLDHIRQRTASKVNDEIAREINALGQEENCSALELAVRCRSKRWIERITEKVSERLEESCGVRLFDLTIDSGIVFGKPDDVDFPVGRSLETPPAEAPKTDAPKRFCNKCGKEIAVDSKFCNHCGSEVAHKENTCPNCGTTNPAGSAFCGICGTKL